jgi:hypothetical protein
MAAHLAAHLPANQFRRGVVSLHGARGSPIEEYLARHEVPVHYINKRRGFDPTTWVRLYRLLRTLKPAIVNTHQTVGRYVYPACWAARQRTPFLPSLTRPTPRDAPRGVVGTRFLHRRWCTLVWRGCAP